MTRTFSSRRTDTGLSVTITHDQGMITAVTPAAAEETNLWIAPSFCDVQINGCLGTGFNSPGLDDTGIRTVAGMCRKHGIGRFLPTVITDSAGQISRSFRMLNQTLNADAELARWMPGFHLEGPYISGEEGARGAHPREHVRNPDWDEFARWQEEAGGRIRMVTVAPERPGALEFIHKTVATGIVVAIGHTLATAEQIRAAVDAGASTSTHLGNGIPALLPRHDNPIWHQLAEDRLWASIITDGHHLPAGVIKTILRAKQLDRVLVTCDASSLAGLPPGRHRDWGSEFEVLPSGKVIVPGTPYLAGSGHFTDDCLSTLLNTTELTLQQAVPLITSQPRRLLNLPQPQLTPGHSLEATLFEWHPGERVQVQETWG